MSISKVLFLTLLLAVAGCDDDDDNPVGGGGPDETAPAISSVEAIDVNHLEVKFNEDVEPEGAESIDNYALVETATPGGEPVDTLAITAVRLLPDQRTVSVTTSAMTTAPYQLSVVGVQDEAGNAIETAALRNFTGTDDPDTTPPELLSSDPADEAVDVGTEQPIELVFSEAILISSLIDGATWSSDMGDLAFTADTEDSLTVSLVPTDPLDPDTQYTLELQNVQDLLGNVMATQSFSFTTADDE